MRPQHQEARDLRRVDRHDLLRLSADVLGGRHLLAAEVKELVLQAGRWLPSPDPAVDLVRALPRAPGGEEVLPTLLVGDAEVVPLRAPLLVPEELRAPFEGRDTAAVAAALRPLDVVEAALVRHRRPVERSGDRGPDAPAVLADHRDRQPPLRMPHTGNTSMNRANRLRVTQHQVDLPIEGA